MLIDYILYPSPESIFQQFDDVKMDIINIISASVSINLVSDNDFGWMKKIILCLHCGELVPKEPHSTNFEEFHLWLFFEQL